MAEEQKTLGKMIFNNPRMNPPFYRIQQANTLIEIIKEVHALKLLNHNHAEIIYAVRDCETIFESLLGTDIDKAVLNHELKEYRERIGNMALGVFFEAIFELNKNFHDYFVERVRIPGVHIEYTAEAEAETKQIIAQSFEPQRLLSFIRYFARASEGAKKEQLSRIRKFLKKILDEPPILAEVVETRTKPLTKIPVGISDWSQSARHALACALVANGMYEECLDYNIAEAYKPLLYKFLGGFKETGDGLIKLPDIEILDNIGRDMPLSVESNMPLSWNEALEKACADREWGHLLGAIIRMGLKHGRIQAQTPFAFMEYFSNRLGKARYGPAIDANNLVLNFVDPPCAGR